MVQFSLNTLDRSPLLGFPADLGGWATAAAAAGFDAIGPDIFSLAAQPTAEVAEEVERAGAGVSDICGLNVDPDPAVTEQALAAIVDWSVKLRPDWVLVRAVGAIDEAMVQQLHRAGEAIVATGAGIAMEPSANSGIHSVSEASDLLDRLDLPGGVVVDTWHLFQRDHTDELARLRLDRIAYVQLSDGTPPVTDDPMYETMHRRLVPGEGTFDLRRFVDVIAAKGFDGIVSAEVLSESERRRGLDDHVQRVYTALTDLWPRSV